MLPVTGMGILFLVPVEPVWVERIVWLIDSIVSLPTPDFSADSFRRGRTMLVVSHTATVDELVSLAPPWTWTRRAVRWRWTDALLEGCGEGGQMSNW